jgi:tRNA/tmRNA/rRNA uracil-C5-methylase (TrmA/RlmC/RlmD family)
MHHAWEHARLNGVENCVFYTRAPAGVVAKLRGRGGRIDAAVITSRRAPAPAELFAGLADAGAQRLALAGSSLPLLAADLRTAQGAGFHPRAVQPLDLLPQTSRIHSVVSLIRGQGR